MPGTLAQWVIEALLAAPEAGSAGHGSETPVWVQVLVPLLTSAIAALGTLVAAQFAIARKARRQRAAEEQSFQLQDLGPLQIAAQNLASKLATIEEKIVRHQQGTGGLEWMRHVFHCVKEPQEILGRPPSQEEYAYWCNGEGFFAVSTIYALAIYLLHARRARREVPKHLDLVRRLEEVRLAMGHEYGIYVMLQDSIGEYVADKHGMPVGYRDFCTMLLDREQRPWFLNALDYFRDIDRKTPEQRGRIQTALRDLLAFLAQATGLPVQGDLLADRAEPPLAAVAAG